MNNFTAPNKISPFFTCKRAPRKFKKKYKEQLNKYPFLTLNEKLWMILGETNNEYKQFLIQEICKKQDYLQQHR